MGESGKLVGTTTSEREGWVWARRMESHLLPCQLPGMGKNGHHGTIMFAYISYMFRKTHCLVMQEKAELRHRVPVFFG